MGEPLDDSMFQQKLTQVAKQPSERDRARLLKNVKDNFIVSAAQAIAFVGECHDAGSRMDAGCMLFEAVKDEEKTEFVKLALEKLFKYPEDKKEFCEKVGVEYDEAQKQSENTGPKVAMFDKHSVPGYTV